MFMYNAVMKQTTTKQVPLTKTRVIIITSMKDLDELLATGPHIFILNGGWGGKIRRVTVDQPIARIFKYHSRKLGLFARGV